MAGRIDIVGLGPGDPGLRTFETQRLLDKASQIVLRTCVHPGLEDLKGDPRVSTCDDLYESLPDFDEVYDAIADRVVGAATSSDVVFAVPGHPTFGEQTVRNILENADEAGIVVILHSAVSALDVVATLTRIDPLADELLILDAESLDWTWEHAPFSGGWHSLDPTRPCLIGQVYSRQIASHVKLMLARVYPEDTSVNVITAAGVDTVERISRCKLFELDHQPVDHLTSILIPPLPSLAVHRMANAVQRLVSHLRAPEGCPWDRKQNHQSLRDAVIEEAYEVVDAIDESDPHQLAEELGDLYLLIAMHAQIADEAGEFSLEDVYGHVARKLIRRHPHVFGDVTATTPDEVVATWEGVKQAERANAGNSDIHEERHPLDKLPRSMPALTKVARVLKERESSSTSRTSEVQELANNFYDALEALVAAGFDPETELLKVARERTTSDPEIISTGSEIQNS